MNLPRVCSFRLTEEEFWAFSKRAEELGKTFSEYTRDLHIEALSCSPAERSLLRRQVIEGELTRELIVKAQDGTNLTDPHLRATITSRVMGRADAIVDGYLKSTNRIGKVLNEQPQS